MSVRLLVTALGAFALWLLVAVVVGVYFAADGGHGGKPSVIWVSVAFGVVVLALDAVLIRRLWSAKRRRS
jgi:ABC-type anion transport system duplicated permease subunit